MHPLVPLSLETPRLLLRGFEDSDCDALYHMIADEESVRYTIGEPLAHWQTWRTLAGYLGHWQLRGYGPYAVVEKSTGSTPPRRHLREDDPASWSSGGRLRVRPESQRIAETGRPTCKTSRRSAANRFASAGSSVAIVTRIAGAVSDR